MRSKKSKTQPLAPRPWQEETLCSETQLAAVARRLADELRPGQLVLLDGEMGAGKSTFARALLDALGTDRPAEGSPTFSIAHVYRSSRGVTIAHLDLYRMRSEEEIEAAGLNEVLWDGEAIALVEWSSMWTSLREQLEKGARAWVVSLAIPEEDALAASQRKLRVMGP